MRHHLLPALLLIGISGSALAASALAAPAPREPDIAYGAYQRGLYLKAFQAATERVGRDPSDAPAMTLLGELYNQGLGIAGDPKRAAEWYRLAAARGDAHALLSLGLMALDGRGVPKDSKQARVWLEQAAAKGEPSACYNVAILNLATGNEADLKKAVPLLRKAADAEIADAQHALGVLYLQGRGVARDPAEAARWFSRAAQNGSVAGLVEHAILLFNGEGIPADETAAAKEFLRAAAQGNAIAQNRLARLYAIGRGVPQDKAEAAAWHMVAAAQGLSDTWLDDALRELTADERARAERLAAERSRPF